MNNTLVKLAVHYCEILAKGEELPELECRLSDCAPALFARAKHLVSSYSDGCKYIGQLCTTDVYYTINKRHIRTTVTFNIDNLSMNSTHLEKKRVNFTDTPWSRVVLSTETLVDPALVPATVEPTLVRIKYRDSYEYTPRMCTSPAFRYDFTKVFSGTSMKEALMNERKDNYTLSIELELIGDEYMNKTNPSHAMHSLLIKMKTLCYA